MPHEHAGEKVIFRGGFVLEPFNPDIEERRFGELARRDALMGKNPPEWVLSERLWERAKEVAVEQGRAEDWPFIVGIYKRMGGGIG